MAEVQSEAGAEQEFPDVPMGRGPTRRCAGTSDEEFRLAKKLGLSCPSAGVPNRLARILWGRMLPPLPSEEKE
jgi:hypothetical protein